MNFDEYLDEIFFEYDEPPRSSANLTAEDKHRLMWLFLEEEQHYEEQIWAAVFNAISDAFGATKKKVSLVQLLMMNSINKKKLVTSINSEQIEKAVFAELGTWIDEKIQEKYELYSPIAPQERYFLNEIENDDFMQRSFDLRSTL